MQALTPVETRFYNRRSSANHARFERNISGLEGLSTYRIWTTSKNLVAALKMSYRLIVFGAFVAGCVKMAACQRR